MKFFVAAFLCLIILTACTPDSPVLQGSSSNPINTSEISESPVFNNVNNLAEANNRSEKPAISADGQLVAFVSKASNLVSGDTNGQQDIFVYDRQTTTIIRVSGN